METKYSVADIVVHHHGNISYYFLVEQINHEMVNSYITNVTYYFRNLETGVVYDYNAVTIDNLTSVKKVA